MRRFQLAARLLAMILIVSLCLGGCGGSAVESGGQTEEAVEQNETVPVESPSLEKETPEEKPAEEAAAQAEAEAAANAAAEAQAALDEGISFWYGINGTPYDMEQAQAAFQKAADLGSADAWYWLGVLTVYGVEADRWQQVLEYYEKAAELGSAWGLYGMGTLYRYGYGAEQDNVRAAELFQQAIDGGCLLGCVGLGELYAYGFGVEADSEKAIELYETALESDDWDTVNEARYGMSYLYYYGTDSIEPDADQAINWVLEAANAEFADGFRSMGIFYGLDPIGEIEPDQNEAVLWYELAAEHGEPYRLAFSYLYGDGVAEDRAYAVKLLRQQETGGREACDCLGALAACYLQGWGVEADAGLARAYAEKAIAADNPYGINGITLAQRVLSALDG